MGKIIETLGDLFEETPPPPPVVAFADQFLENFVTWLDNDYVKLQAARSPGIHASSAWKTCARSRVLQAVQGAESTPEVLKAGNFLTFDIGHAMHHWWQNNYLGPMGILVGSWFCSKCDCVTAQGVQPAACPVCKSDRRKTLTYDETPIVDTEIGYTGHCDGVLKFGIFEGVFEFKTASASDFPNIDKPKIEHVVQAHAYMHGLKLQKALIVYQNKGKQASWRKDGPKWIVGRPEIKVFQIDFDLIFWKTYADRIRDWHAAGKDIEQRSVVVAEDAIRYTRLCANEQCALAAACPVASACFNLS